MYGGIERRVMAVVLECVMIHEAISTVEHILTVPGASVSLV